MKLVRSAPALVAAAVLIQVSAGAQAPAPASKGSSVTRASFGTTPDGKSVDVYTFSNANGIEIKAITYGGIITSLRVPDRAGQARRRRARLRHPRRLPQETRRTSARSSAATATASPRRSSRSTARPTRWRRTTARTTCTAACKGFDKVVWKAEPFKGPTASAWRSRARARTARKGYPGNADGARHLHADRQERADRRLPRDDRQGDAGQPDAAQLLQPGRATGRATSSATS